MRDAPCFLALPPRAAKPRSAGLTSVLDRGVPVGVLEAVLAAAAPSVDVWKFGWGTAYLDRGLGAKVDRLRTAAVDACMGGTLLEIAWRQGAADACLDWAAAVGLPCVEVSDGAVGMGPEEKRRLISVARRRFRVLAEVGSKDPAVALAPAQWAAAAVRDVDAGADIVVAEGRESGTVGVYAADGGVREPVVDALVAAVGVERLLFEAPRKQQQAWFIRRFGPDVNLGNVALDDVVGLEALRLGLRADTLGLGEGPGTAGYDGGPRAAGVRP